MPDLAPAVLAGLLAGWAIAVPVGAVSVMIVLLGARHGWRTGCAGGLGAAVVDGAYATVAVVAGAALAPVLVQAGDAVRWVSAAVLVVVAALLLRSPAAGTEAADPSAPSTPGDATRTATGAGRPAGAATRAMTPARAFWLVLGSTVVNPTTVVYFVALTTGSATTTLTTGGQRAAFAVGALVASAAWQLVLGTVGGWGGGLLTGPRGRRWTGLVGAAAVLVLAVRTALG